MKVFVDSSAFICLWNKKDINHKKALQISKRLLREKAIVLTSNLVVSEVLTVLSMKVSKKIAIEFGKESQKEDIRVLYIDEGWHQAGWEVFQTKKSKNVSFSDCVSFALIEDLNIDKAFSFDKDFKKHGLPLL